MHGIRRTNYQTTVCPRRRKVGFRDRCPSTPVYLACLPHVLDSLHISSKNAVIKQHISRTQCYERPHCLYTLSLLLCKSLPSTEGRGQKNSVLRKAKGGMLRLRQEVQDQETVPLQETRSHRHHHCSLGTSDFGHWVFSFTGKCLSHNW